MCPSTVKSWWEHCILLFCSLFLPALNKLTTYAVSIYAYYVDQTLQYDIILYTPWIHGYCLGLYGTHNYTFMHACSQLGHVAIRQCSYIYICNSCNHAYIKKCIYRSHISYSYTYACLHPIQSAVYIGINSQEQNENNKLGVADLKSES